MNLVERIYAAAANAGLLRECTWQPSDGRAAQTYKVCFAAPDETLLDGITMSTEYVMTYPASVFAELESRETVTVAGVAFQVREVRALGDGSEVRARLARL